MERLLEDASFNADVASQDAPVSIDAATVDKTLNGLVVDEDLSRFIL